MAPNPTLILIFIVCAFCISQNGVYAFGAGNIPSFAYMEGKAFRHGDIEDVISELIKRGAGSFALASMLSKGSKFNGLDVKRVYFGNWLRDFSQAVDVGSLKRLELQTIITLCMALGFLAHGYATHEFEVTPERLGVYLPTEHIDNPKGYAEGEDARRYHPALRGPVDPRELEFDQRTGMKNYIANEQGHWDTSKALVRRTLEKCIQMGRQNRKSGQKQDEYEAFRLLGQALHTLEDFSAHSNFCELTLISMGYNEVFPHVGDQVRIQAPNGKYVAPLVTGSFGSSDFIHSLLGEATDHLSEASVTDLNAEFKKARSKSLTQTRGGPSSPADGLKGLLFTLPGGAGSDMSRDVDSIEMMRAGAGGKKPENMSPQELHSAIWKILTFRDSVAKKIEITIEKIPGLESLVEKISDSISVFVFTALEPILKPVLKMATDGLQAASGEVIDNRDQYEVFNNPRASDPTHSFLSKDHFNLLLNEPAGEIAQRIVVYTVKLVTKAWDNNSVNVNQLTEDVLQCLFHPDFHNPQSQIQKEMIQCVRDWLSKAHNPQSIIQRLNKEAVRNHQNVRRGGEGGAAASQGSFAEGQAHHLQQSLSGAVPGVGMLMGQSKEAEAGRSPGYPGEVGGYPQAGKHHHGGPPAPGEVGGYPQAGKHHHGGAPAPGYTSGPMGSGGHQHGGDRFGPTSIYMPPSGAPPHANTFLPSGGSLPPPYSGHSGPTLSPSQQGGYASFPSGDGKSFPGSNPSSLPGGPPFPGGGYHAPHGPPSHSDIYAPPGPPSHSDIYAPPGPPSHSDIYAPPGPPSHSDIYAPPGHLHSDTYHPPSGPPLHSDRYHAPTGAPPGFPGGPGEGDSAGTFGFPAADTYPPPPEFPGRDNNSYPYRDGSGW